MNANDDEVERLRRYEQVIALVVAQPEINNRDSVRVSEDGGRAERWPTSR